MYTLEAMPTGGIGPYRTPAPPEGYGFYLYDDDYLGESNQAVGDWKPVYRVTARCLVQWAVRYRAHQTMTRQADRAGDLPDDPDERRAFIDELFDWFDAPDTDAPGFFAAELSLINEEGIWLLNAHDGFPGPLTLKAEQFAKLQLMLASEGMPADFYYPLDQRTLVVEPTMGGPLGAPPPAAEEPPVILALRAYSPRSWAKRDVAAIRAMRLPTDQERRSRLFGEIVRLTPVLMRRRAELTEPLRPSDPDELAEVEEFHTTVLRFQMQHLRRGQPGYPGARDLSAGWPGVPNFAQALESALPLLRRLHQNRGIVTDLKIGGITSQGKVRRWSCSVVVPDVGKFDHVINMGLLEAQAEPYRSQFSFTPRTQLIDLADPVIPEVVDVADAFLTAEDITGRRFRAETGSPMRNIWLERGGAEHSWLWHFVYFSIFPDARVTLLLDGKTGELISIDEENKGLPAGIWIGYDGPELPAEPAEGQNQAVVRTNEDALDVLTRQIDAKPTSDALIARGTLYWKRGDYEQALADFKQALASPGLEWAWLEQACGDLSAETGDDEQAITYYSRAIALQPKDGSSFARRGEAYRRGGQRDMALADFDRALELVPAQGWVLEHRANLRIDAGQLLEAYDDLTVLAHLSPADTALQRRKAALLVRILAGDQRPG